MRPLSCSESRWVYALKICIENFPALAPITDIVLYGSALLSGAAMTHRDFDEPLRMERARSLLTSVWEEEIEVGHGSIEPDNSGGTVDIEGFFRRYEGA